MKFSIIVLLVSLVTIWAKPLPTLEELYLHTDSLLSVNSNEIRVEQVESDTPLYMAYAYYTLDLPFEKAAIILSDFERYEAIFKHIVEMRPIEDRWHPNDTLYYVVGKTSFLHGWGIGKISRFDSSDSRIDLEIRPASNAIVNKYRRINKGVMKYYIKKVHLDGTLIPIDEKRCRLGIRGISSTNTAVPTWILSLIMKIIYPGLMNDVEKYGKTVDVTCSS